MKLSQAVALGLDNLCRRAANEALVGQFGLLAFDQTKPVTHIFDRTASKAPLASALPLAAHEQVDVATVERIKSEVVQHSQVMDIVSWLTDVYGARLTGSPNTKAASDWAVTTMRSWKLRRSNRRAGQWRVYETRTSS